MTTVRMADAAYLPASSSALRGAVILAGYLAAPGAAHPWSADDWHRGRTMPNVGWLVPIYVYATGQRDAAGAARSTVDQARALGAPAGSVVVLDVESNGAQAAHQSGFPQTWAEVVIGEEFAPWIYTSDSTAWVAGSIAKWVAHWTGTPHLEPGSIATQWTAPTVDPSLAVDLSEVDVSALRSLIPANPGSSSMDTHHLAAPVVAIVDLPGGNGYWIVAADGGVFAFGEAPHFDNVPAAGHIAAPIVGAASSPTGKGLYLVGADGGVFGLGDAHFHGSIPSLGIGPAPGTPGDPTP